MLPDDARLLEGDIRIRIKRNTSELLRSRKVKSRPRGHMAFPFAWSPQPYSDKGHLGEGLTRVLDVSLGLMRHTSMNGTWAWYLFWNDAFVSFLFAIV